jgi:hypothetical protein
MGLLMLLSSHSGTQLLVTTVRACGHRPTTASVYQALQLFDHHLPLLSPLLLQDPHPPKTASSLRARVTTRQCQVIPAKRLWTSTALSPILNSAAGTLQSAQTVLVCGLVTTTVLASPARLPLGPPPSSRQPSLPPRPVRLQPRMASSQPAHATTRPFQVTLAKRLWTSTALSPTLSSAAGTLLSEQTAAVSG